MTLNTHSPTSAMLILTMQMTFIAENIAIILNILLMATFYYQIRKEKQRIAANCFPAQHKMNKRSWSFSMRNRSQHKNELNKETIYVTWTLLIIGFIFSLCQGLIENWLTNDCGAAWLQWITFFFYAAHRSMLLFSFFHRLKVVFRGSAFGYQSWFYYILMFLIVSYFIVSYIIYGIDHAVTKVNIEMNTGFSGNILCSWSFGVLVSGFARPIEIALILILVIAFLYKLWALHRLLVHNDIGSGEHRKINKLLVVFRKVMLLTLCAITTSVLVIFGYINYKPFAFAFSLDAVFNSFCVFLMFQFNQKFIRPCFGNKCDRFCCIKFDGVCKCVIVCGNCCKNRNTEKQKPPQDIIKVESITSPKSNESQVSKPSSDIELKVTSFCDKSSEQSAELSAEIP